MEEEYPTRDAVPPGPGPIVTITRPDGSVSCKRGRAHPWIDATVRLQEVMPSAIALIRRRFPAYRVVRIRDAYRGRETRRWFGGSGDPDGFDAEWEFAIVKKKSDVAGPTKMLVSLHPVWEFITPMFPNADEVMVEDIEGKGRGPRTIDVGGIPCSALDAKILLFDQGNTEEE